MQGPLHVSNYTRRLLIAGGLLLGVLAVSALFWQVGHVVLLLFGAALFAVFVDAITSSLQRWMGCSRAVGLTATLCALLGALVGMGWFAGPAIAGQLGELVDRLPQAIEEARTQLRGSTWGQVLLGGSDSGIDEMAAGSRIAERLPSAFSSVFGIAVELGVVLLVGVYLAAEPDVYVRGALHLVPRQARPQARDLLARLGRALRAWLIGRIASMAVVAMLTALGLWGVGSPLPLALGLIAGLFSFVPYVGPVLAAVPGILIAISGGWSQMLQVSAVYVGVQVLESNAITPLIQRQAVSLPPALLLASQMAMTVLFGALGVLLATPLLVSVMVLVQAVYVREVIGDEVDVLPERSAEDGTSLARHEEGEGEGHVAPDDPGAAHSHGR